MGNLINKKNKYNYFDEFEKISNYSIESAHLVKEVILEYSQEKIEEQLKKLHIIENNADICRHNMLNYLAKDFLPPIEMEDILVLSQKLDDIIDLIEEIGINIDMFNIKTMREEIFGFVDLLTKCCEYENELLKSFKNFKNIEGIKEKVIKINDLEEQGDKLYINSMKKLYRDGTSTIDIMKWTTIYNCFENCLDICESIANEAESIVLRNI